MCICTSENLEMIISGFRACAKRRVPERRGGVSLPVIDQDFLAGLADPGAVLLEAGQHH